MFSGSVNAGFVFALPFHHGELEPDYVGVSTGGAYMRGKNTSARLCAKNAGGACARGGAYLRDTTVLHQFVLCPEPTLSPGKPIKSYSDFLGKHALLQ